MTDNYLSTGVTVYTSRAIGLSESPVHTFHGSDAPQRARRLSRMLTERYENRRFEARNDPPSHESGKSAQSALKNALP